MPDRPGRLIGYTPLPGSARQYRTPSGEIISRYRYDSLRLQAAGWKNRGELERARRSDQWPATVKLARKASADRVQPSAFQLAMTPQGRNAWRVEQRRAALGRDVLGNRIPDSADSELSDPDGPLAQLLVDMGRRSPDDRWNVGDTPKGHRKAA